MLSLAPSLLYLEVLNLAEKLLYLLPCVGAFVCARLCHHLELLLQIRDLVCLKEMLKSKGDITRLRLAYPLLCTGY
jgi:hypothetical protein